MKYCVVGYEKGQETPWILPTEREETPNELLNYLVNAYKDTKELFFMLEELHITDEKGVILARYRAEIDEN